MVWFFKEYICILTLSFWVLMLSKVNMERKKGVTGRLFLILALLFSTAKGNEQFKTVSKKVAFFSKGRSVEQILTASCRCLQEAVNTRFTDVEKIQIFIYKPESKAKWNKFLNFLCRDILSFKTKLHCFSTVTSTPCMAQSWSCWYSFRSKVFFFLKLQITRSSEGSVFQGWWEKTAFNAVQLLPHFATDGSLYAKLF